MDNEMLMQMLQSGGVPQGQAAQNAAPTAQQPGGGPQMVQGLTPEQQSLMSAFKLLITQGKQVCSSLDRLGKRNEANTCDSYLNKITSMMLDLEEDFKEEAVNASMANAVAPASANTQNMI